MTSGARAFWRDRPTLVTGATGFVGGCLTRRLASTGADVVCLVRDRVPRCELLRTDLRDRVNIVRGDVRDQATVERVLGEYEVEVVFHLAAQTIVPIANRNPVSTFETNIGGTWALLEACRRSPALRAVVVASSDKAYGTHAQLPYAEDMPLQARYPYDVSKACADLIARSYGAMYDLPVTIARCANFFGGGDLNWSRLVPGSVRSLLRGERVVIRSDGSPVRDYFYVEDGAGAYLRLAEKLAGDVALRGRAFNFSTETPLTVREMAERIHTCMGIEPDLDIRGTSSGEIEQQYLSAARAREELDWRPEFSLDEALRRTVAWYRGFLREVG